MLEKVKFYLNHPRQIYLPLAIRGKLNWISDVYYLKIIFKLNIGASLNLNNPRTFNEKLQWLKIHDRNPQYTKMVDKYEVKKYVADLIGDKYIIPLLGVWDNFDDIDFSSLPDSFVLKCTHDCGGLVIVKDKSKLDVMSAKKKIQSSMKRNYYWMSREWPYKNVKPRIIAEQYMVDDSGTELRDYKFLCFNGKVRSIFTCTERFSSLGLKVTFFNPNWEEMPFERHYPKSQVPIQKPHCLDEMKKLAEILSKDIPFVRVDFYEVNRHVYFGELTFYPGGGLEEFTPSCWDKVFGDWIELPKCTNQ